MDYRAPGNQRTIIDTTSIGRVFQVTYEIPQTHGSEYLFRARSEDATDSSRYDVRAHLADSYGPTRIIRGLFPSIVSSCIQSLRRELDQATIDRRLRSGTRSSSSDDALLTQDLFTRRMDFAIRRQHRHGLVPLFRDTERLAGRGADPANRGWLSARSAAGLPGGSSRGRGMLKPVTDALTAERLAANQGAPPCSRPVHTYVAYLPSLATREPTGRQQLDGADLACRARWVTDRLTRAGRAYSFRAGQAPRARCPVAGYHARCSPCPCSPLFALISRPLFAAGIALQARHHSGTDYLSTGCPPHVARAPCSPNPPLHSPASSEIFLPRQALFGIVAAPWRLLALRRTGTIRPRFDLT